MKEFGQELAKQAFPKKTRVPRKPKEGEPTPAWRKLRRKWLKQNKELSLGVGAEAPKPKVQLPVSTVEPLENNPGWNKIKFDQDSYTAAEVVVMIRNGDTSPLRPLIVNMKHVRAYVDQYGSVLLRPVTAPEEASGVSALPKGAEGVRGLRSAPKTPRVAVPVVLGGAQGLNPSKEGTKRFFLIESILMGGTAVEIVKRADKMARKGGYKKGEVLKVITPSTKNVTAFAEKMVARVARAGKKANVVVTGKNIQIVPDKNPIATD